MYHTRCGPTRYGSVRHPSITSTNFKFKFNFSFNLKAVSEKNKTTPALFLMFGRTKTPTTPPSPKDLNLLLPRCLVLGQLGFELFSSPRQPVFMDWLSARLFNKCNVKVNETNQCKGMVKVKSKLSCRAKHYHTTFFLCDFLRVCSLVWPGFGPCALAIFCVSWVWGFRVLVLASRWGFVGFTRGGWQTMSVGNAIGWSTSSYAAMACEYGGGGHPCCYLCVGVDVCMCVFMVG